jgi:hypothetical protein
VYYSPEVLKKLVKCNATLSGVIVKIENVGYAIWNGLSFGQIAALSKAYEEIELPRPFGPKFPFAPKYIVANQPAELVMNTIHLLNEKDGLPGLAKHKEFRLLEAA